MVRGICGRLGSIWIASCLLLLSVVNGLTVIPPLATTSLKAQRGGASSLMMMAAINDGAASAASAVNNPRQLVSQGMKTFRDGNIDQSIQLFDRADQAVPDGSLRPYLWQRGISYYYADRFQEGSDQFRFDVRVNPLDVEEIVWDIACLSRMNPEAVPPPNMMALPKGRKDRRKIMSTVYALFRGEATEHDLAVAGHQGNVSDEFYALFYLGLYCESRGETGKAASYMKSAAATTYAQTVGFGDYMTACARVHCKLRGWV